MKLPSRLREYPVVGGGMAFSEPHETADGTVIITVTASGLLGQRPIGVFVVHGGEVQFESAVDAGRVAIIGVLTGFVAAAFATAAVLKRPPWPDVRISQELTKRVRAGR
ncbi:hypothetical protein [Nocardia inohanensis]|uniref:hypothetical protein n=1 Tax=Nocardia inohanensis TaxID=209246 RepID=UPI00082D8A6C|nr:hypothetical protein [Nocardia inohanensis]